ncbi:M20/M25/M40 family metallo-hydrolase [Cellulomonas sp. JZ18]|uniref:M20/M25/M40 family metallo-hydrolase n=1 Tax=Cellulomonas sp. JZ18 TaxID=2654191 RepID=UPI0012D37984|nr:M20/M25/M40 family metallo-hydrolase [Cellulomonas sp. JZ18]QGQ18119.1 M20/M25/M40 family metallo-hydrolase [Cellulomonas sp. JZ18]
MSARRPTATLAGAAALALGVTALLVPPAAAAAPAADPAADPAAELTTGLTTGLTAELAHGRPGTPDRFARTVSARAVVRHLEAFQRIADRHDGNRAALTSGYEASARYVERTLRHAGYRTWRDPFTFEREVVDAATLTLPDGSTADVDQMEYAPSTPEGGLTAAVAVPDDPFGCTTEAWGDADPTGAIAVVSRGGDCPFSAKATAAEALGAVGVVVYNNAEGLFAGTLGAEGVVAVPVVGLSQADGQRLVQAAQSTAVEVTLDARVHFEEVESFNVLAETRAGRDDNVVMLGAHLDSVEEGAGINDNGSGSAAILEVAVKLAKERRLNNTVRFAWWGAEELGLEGSTAYVRELAEQEGELDRIATYLNFDMVGSPNYVIGVYDADQSTYEAPVEVPPGSAETEDVLTGYFDRIGQPWVDTEFSGRSDYQEFILRGVPASGLFTGADDIKTEEEVALFGGTAGIPHDPNYHSPQDDITNVDHDALRIMTRAIAYATYSLAQDTSAINGVSGPGDQGGHGWPGKPGRPWWPSGERSTQPLPLDDAA